MIPCNKNKFDINVLKLLTLKACSLDFKPVLYSSKNLSISMIKYKKRRITWSGYNLKNLFFIKSKTLSNFISGVILSFSDILVQNL